MRVLHVAETAKGGVGTYLAQLAPLQGKRLGTDNVRIILPEEHAFQAGQDALPMIRGYLRRDRSWSSLRRLAIKLREEIATFRPDVIHAHSTFAGLAVRLLYGWRPRRPIVVYCAHGWAFDVQANRAKQIAAASLERALARWCDRVVVISQHEQDQARAWRIGDGKLSLVLNGIVDRPPGTPAAWQDDRLKVLFIGRLDRQKGHDTLLDAIEPHPDRICLRIAGDAVVGGGSTRQVKGQADNLGWLSGEEMAAQLAAADVVAVPSRWEGFGLAALEAMRAGRMVVASSVGGLKEIVREGETGRFVEPDTPVQLARALLIDNPAQREWMGRNGRARFLDLFTAERMSDELLALYVRPAVASVSACA